MKRTFKTVTLSELKDRRRYDIKVRDPRPDTHTLLKVLYHRFLRKDEVEYIAFHPSLEIVNIRERPPKKKTY